LEEIRFGGVFRRIGLAYMCLPIIYLYLNQIRACICVCFTFLLVIGFCCSILAQVFIGEFKYGRLILCLLVGHYSVKNISGYSNTEVGGYIIAEILLARWNFL